MKKHNRLLQIKQTVYRQAIHLEEYINTTYLRKNKLPHSLNVTKMIPKKKEKYWAEIL
jgi:hypothetical protein